MKFYFFLLFNVFLNIKNVISLHIPRTGVVTYHEISNTYTIVLFTKDTIFECTTRLQFEIGNFSFDCSNLKTTKISKSGNTMYLVELFDIQNIFDFLGTGFNFLKIKSIFSLNNGLFKFKENGLKFVLITQIIHSKFHKKKTVLKFEKKIYYSVFSLNLNNIHENCVAVYFLLYDRPNYCFCRIFIAYEISDNSYVMKSDLHYDYNDLIVILIFNEQSVYFYKIKDVFDIQEETFIN